MSGQLGKVYIHAFKAAHTWSFSTTSSSILDAWAHRSCSTRKKCSCQLRD